MERKFLNKDVFFQGINYWASHAGTAMWSDWREDVIEEDLKKLASIHVEVLRVFPLWSDFQPLTNLLGWGGLLEEYSHGEEFLDASTPEGRAGIDLRAIEKFQWFCDKAKEYGMKLIVPMITGWMSGRCFFPEALSGRNVVTDPVCLRWERRFVQYFVERFKNQENIIAWELGNECNCLAAEVPSADAAYLWTATIVDSIKSFDDSRPVISGMHGLTSKVWNLSDQAELCDMLTIHPYPLFTPDCALDPLVSPRTILHSPAELTTYADMSGKECLVEEIGSLSSLMGDEKTVADFVRANLFNAWAYNGLGFLWWTGFEQSHLTKAPYDWCDCERELGLFRVDGNKKACAEEFIRFKKVIDAIPALSARERNAVCMVCTKDWKRAFGAFMLAKRAGLELKFAAKDLDYEPDDSKLYFLPGIEDSYFMRGRVMKKMLQRAKDGATLVFTYDGGLLSPFETIIGCASLGRMTSSEMKITLDGEVLRIPRQYAVRLKPVSAEVLAYDQDGNPAIVVNAYGKGKIMFVNAPIESYFAVTPQVASERVGYEKIYALAKRLAGVESGLEKCNPLTNFTIHRIDEKRALAIVINNTEEVISEKFSFNGGTVGKVYYGEIDTVTEKADIPAADALIFEIQKR